MAITVIDAMNGVGQDWECSEVLRAEVRRLRADLAAAEQRAAAAEAVMEAFRKALVSIIMERYVRHDGHPDTPLHMVEQAYAALSGVPLTHDDIVAVDGWTREEAQAALDALTAPTTQPDERAATEANSVHAGAAWAVHWAVKDTDDVDTTDGVAHDTALRD